MVQRLTSHHSAAQVLGSGTTGTVKLAVHVSTGVRVAIKIIPKRKPVPGHNDNDTCRGLIHEMVPGTVSGDYVHVAGDYLQGVTKT